MKVRNIAFSGFAAAILAGVCGAADAAVNLVTQEYVTAKMADKQDVLTSENAGTGIKIENGVISAEVDLSSTIGELTNENGETITVAEALAEKQDKLTESESAALETIAGSENLETVLNSGVSSDTVQQVTTNATNITNLTQTVEGKQDKLTAGTGIAISEDNVISSTIDTAVFATKSELDSYATDDDLSGVKTELQEQIAGVVAGDMADALKAYATTESVNAIDTRLTTAEGKITTLETTVAGLENYDDAEVRGLISTNATNIATNTEDIAKINAANYISGDGSAGSYLITKDGNGGVVWSEINIIDKEGNVMSLTGQAE